MTERDDPYATESYRWWHLSEPSPELTTVIADGWIRPPGRVLDLGCGPGVEVAYLAQIGFAAYGVDLSPVALANGRLLHPQTLLVRADVRSLPFASDAFDVLLDRGTFHYLSKRDRGRYAQEAARVLRTGGRLFIRACLQSHGVRNDIDADVIRDTFRNWRLVGLERAEIPSDTRPMNALVLRLEQS